MLVWQRLQHTLRPGEVEWCIISWFLTGVGEERFGGAGAVWAPFPNPHPPLFRGQASGSPKASGRGLGRGVRGYPPYVPQNEPQNALVMLRYVS